MKLVSFRVEMFKSIIDSGWVRVSDLTTIVGKNEAGKTSLLKALHKLKPFNPEPYSMENEWPRGHRPQRNPKHVVCRAKFALSDDEITDLTAIAGRNVPFTEIEVSRSYEGNLEIVFEAGLFDERLRPNQFDSAAIV
jgi:predicted ATP-dependent endonuclease of OLD family